jgi:NSS family neurotransmitter:Na+ symporter
MRENFSSKLGFILTAAGSAVGLGNICRFPYGVNENGGAAFLLVYLFCVVIIGFPFMWLEIGLGRMTGKGMSAAFEKTGANWFFKLNPLLALIISFIILSYYSVLAGWCLGYLGLSLVDKHEDFGNFVSNANYTVPSALVFILLVVWIVRSGVKAGIERASKIMMPLLFVILIGMAIYSLSLPNAYKGVEFLFHVDFSKITPNLLVSAFGQALFSLSLGIGGLTIYGSYLSKKDNIVSISFWVILMDTLVALLAGLIIFPAVFSFGISPKSELAFTFNVLPEIFSSMPYGYVLSVLFFLLLALAALTSGISFFEILVGNITDKSQISRKKVSYLLGIFVALLAIPSALSTGANAWFSSVSLFGKSGFLDILDHTFGTVLFIISAAMTSIYVGWFMPTKEVAEEISVGCSMFAKPLFLGVSLYKVFIFSVKFIIPILIAFVFAQKFL